jgi:hypothetical protein
VLACCGKFDFSLSPWGEGRVKGTRHMQTGR